MIKWIALDPTTAAEELEENTFLISTGEYIVSANHDAVQKCFIVSRSDHEHVYRYRDVRHYAELNWPEE